jgi:rubrerythrin
MSFTFANRVEKVHAGLYQKAAGSVASGHDLPATPMFVCQVCGNTVEGEAPVACPICGAPKSRFKKVE